MKFFELCPEVPAEEGDRSRIDRTVHPPKVEAWHLSMRGWMGDDLMECFPSYFVTRALKQRLEHAQISGLTFHSVEVEKSDFFLEMYPDKKLPQIFWMKISDQNTKETGIYLSENHHLIVSEEMLSFLKTGTLNDCTVEEILI